MNNLIKFRKRLNLTQGEMALKLGVPRATYQSYENGRNQPNIQMLIKMADVFKVSIDSLVEHTGELIDLQAISANQRLAVEAIVNKLTDEQVARVVGYIDNLK